LDFVIGRCEAQTQRYDGPMRRPAFALFLAILSTDAYAQASSSSNIAREYRVGEARGLRVVAWIKEQATLADDDWFRLEINNSGPDLVVRTAAILAPGQYGSNTTSDLTGALPLDIPARGRAGPFDTFVLPAGRFNTSVPGTFIAGWLGPRHFGEYVTMHLVFRAELVNADAITFSNPEAITFRWSRPGFEQVDELRRQAAVLLRRAFDPANPLSLAQGVKLRVLLGMSEIRASLVIDDVMAANRRRQLSGRSFELSELVGVMFERWQTEPKVVGFFEEALRERGPEAIADLSAGASPPWDASLLEPIVSLVERISRERSPKSWEQKTAIGNALAYLDRMYTKWRDNPAIAPRLSAAVLRSWPAPEPSGMYAWSDMLALTHDPTLIKVLRPYLDDGTLDTFTSQSSNMPYGVTPMRYSELAANAICRLLGEPIMFSPHKRSKAPAGGPYPEWAEWDKQLAALRRRLVSGSSPIAGSKIPRQITHLLRARPN
jgi:hypothetical protein